jgi:RHS repeat-associated protein
MGWGGDRIRRRPARFAGQIQIGELMMLGARIYDPAVGRFLSPDPVLQLINQYAYALGNPVWFSDPYGNDALCAIEGTAVTTSFATAAGSLFFVAGPLAALVAAIGFGVAGLGFAIFVASECGQSEASLSSPEFALRGTTRAGPVELLAREPRRSGPRRLHSLLIAAQILLAPS